MVLPYLLVGAVTYLVITYLITSLVIMLLSRLIRSLPNVSSRSGPSVLSNPLVSTTISLMMYVPLASVLITSLVLGYGFSGFTSFLISWFRFDINVLIKYLLVPTSPTLALLTYLVIIKLLNMLDEGVLKGLLKSPKSVINGLVKAVLLAYLVSITGNALLALGEEFGWRCYLVTSLMKYLNSPLTTLVVGIAWGLWHVPLVAVLSKYFRGLIPWYSIKLGVISYLIMCTILNYQLTTLLLSTESVLPLASLHGAVNALWQLPQYVTKVRVERKLLDLTKMFLASLTAWLVGTLAVLVVATM